MRRLIRALVAPERLYMVSLAFTGFASLVSIALPAASRGVLAGTIVSATLGAAVGSFSIDTFLLSRPAGWVLHRGRWWVLALVSGSVVLSAAAAAVITTAAGLGSYAISMAGACALTVFNASGSLAMRVERFALVYAVRAFGGFVLMASYAVLVVDGNRDASRWGALWLGSQLLVAAVLGVTVLGKARGFGQPGDSAEPEAIPVEVSGRRRDDLFAMAKLHAGICAQMLTFRLDQVLLARFAGPRPLGVYALAVAAMEFAQAGGQVAAQRILADRRADPGREDSVAPLIKGSLPVAVLAVVGLAAVARLVPQYSGGWLMGLLLLPGCLAVVVGKAWSASLLKRRGEQATTWVALATLAVAVPAYLLAVPWFGALGAAVASSLLYAVHALLSRRSLGRQPNRSLVEQAA